MTKSELRTYYNTALPVVQHWLYLVPFVILLVYQQMLWSGIPLFGRQLPEYVDHVEFFAMNLLMFRVFFFQKMSIKQAIVVGFMTVLVFISSLRADNRTVLLAWTFIIAAKDQDFEELVRIAFWILLATSLLLIGLCFAGVIEDVTTVREKAGTVWVRHAMGFPHPNSLGMAALHIYACSLYLRRNKLRWVDPAVGIVGTIFVFWVPNSISACLCMSMLTCVSLILLIKLNMPIKIVIAWCLLSLVVLCNLVCTVYSLAFDKLPLAVYLDKALTYRLSSAFSVFSFFGVTPLGIVLPPMATPSIIDNVVYFMPWLDASYMDLMLRYGVLIYLLYSGLYIAAAFRIRKTGNLMLLGIMATYAAHGIMENSLYILRFSIFPIAMAAMLYGSKSTVAMCQKAA